MAYDSLCVNCFEQLNDGESICPRCSFNSETNTLPQALKYRTLLNDRYVTGVVKRYNSESFTYIAMDTVNQNLVEIEEFFPSKYALREENTSLVVAKDSEIYKKIYARFFSHYNILKNEEKIDGISFPETIFVENNTCYVVYEHHVGVSLNSYLKKNGKPLDFSQVKELFTPFIESLNKLHLQRIVHLGISPFSIIVTSENKLVLLDFTTPIIRRKNNIFASDLKNGCAGLEQYKKGIQCSARTDVYGLASTIFYCLTLEKLKDAPERENNPKLLISNSVLENTPQNAVKALAHALSVNPEFRTSNMSDFKEELFLDKDLSSTGRAKVLVSEVSNYRGDGVERHIPPVFWFTSSFLVSLLIIGMVAIGMVKSGEINANAFTNFIESLTVTDTQQLVKVPNLEGHLYKDWVTRLNNDSTYRFKFELVEELSEDIKQGYIISQEPSAGEFIEMDSEVKVVVSLGSKTRILPKVNGKKLEEVEKLLTYEGLTIIIEESYSRDIPRGSVLWYGGDFNSGQEVEYGSAIPVIVSTGN